MKKINILKKNYINLSVVILIIGLTITAIGLTFMLNSVIKYKNYYIVYGNVVDYRVQSEGSATSKDKISYKYKVKYKVNNKEYVNHIEKYINEEYHINDEIEITVEKNNLDNIDMFYRKYTGTYISISGIIIAFIGFITYILIKKIKK